MTGALLVAVKGKHKEVVQVINTNWRPRGDFTWNWFTYQNAVDLAVNTGLIDLAVELSDTMKECTGLEPFSIVKEMPTNSH